MTHIETLNPLMKLWLWLRTEHQNTYVNKYGEEDGRGKTIHYPYRAYRYPIKYKFQ